MDDFTGFFDTSMFPAAKVYEKADFDPKLHRARLGFKEDRGFIPDSGFSRSDRDYHHWWVSLEDDERARFRVLARDARTPEELAADNDRETCALESAGVPTRIGDRLITGSFKATPAMDAADSFEAGMLVLSGTTGCGKSFAAGWIVHRDQLEQAARKELGERDSTYWLPKCKRVDDARFVSVSALSRISQYDEESIRGIERVRLLVIDDIGAEYSDAKGYSRSMFDALINARYADQLRTVLTTNLTGKQFKERYGERIADRIREAGRFVELDSASLRGKS